MTRRAPEPSQGDGSRFVTGCLFLSLVILTWTGVGNPAAAGMLGLLLCAAGCTLPEARADLRFLIPLVLYNLFSLAASLAAYRNTVDGYASTQMLFPLLYLLLASLEDTGLLRRLCALWTGCAAAYGIVRFVLEALQGRTGRLDGFLGNPNAMGIFLVLGWFALLGGSRSWLEHLEPLLLAALGLTLSMGSFLALAAGILALVLLEPQGRFRRACLLLAKCTLGIGVGLLLYLAAARTGQSWACLPVAAYLLALALGWRSLCRFLDAPRTAAALAAAGTLVALAAILARPSAVATFAERLEMMASARKYLTVNPLLGVGPYRWRLLDLEDGGTYFNTWHIHNLFLHTAVEMGWPALAALVLAALRTFRKAPEAPRLAACTAFLVHNLIDTSFFYLGVTALVLLTAARPQEGGRRLSGTTLKILCGAASVFFACNLFLIFTA